MSDSNEFPSPYQVRKWTATPNYDKTISAKTDTGFKKAYNLSKQTQSIVKGVPTSSQSTFIAQGESAKSAIGAAKKANGDLYSHQLFDQKTTHDNSTTTDLLAKASLRNSTANNQSEPRIIKGNKGRNGGFVFDG